MTNETKKINMNNRTFSKSSINLYLQCPYKWKKCYIDKIRTIPSTAMLRGSRIHRKIEHIYKKIKLENNDSPIPTIVIEPDEETNKFIEFEKKRIKDCVNEKGEFDIKYFKPLFQELRLSSQALELKGIVDAVYINPKDDGVIIIDWKTGQFHKNKLNDYRFELAVYAELLKTSGRVDNVKYWGIYFTDKDKLFFEEVDSEHVRRMYDTIERVKEDIKQNKFEPKWSFWCKYCQFKDECNV